MLKEVKIELTNKCSRNCYHCSSRASNKNIIMLDYQDVIKVIREAADLGVKKIVFSL